MGIDNRNNNPEEEKQKHLAEGKPEGKDGNSHLLDSSISGPNKPGDAKNDQPNERPDGRPLGTDRTNTYQVPPSDQQFQAIKNYGDDTRGAGAARPVDIKLADGSSVRGVDSFDRSTGQHTYIVNHPENGMTQYKPVNGTTLQAVDRNGNPTGDSLAVKPNQIVYRDQQNERPQAKPDQQQQKNQEQQQQKNIDQQQQKSQEQQKNQEQQQQKNLEQQQQKSQEQKSLEQKQNRPEDQGKEGKDGTKGDAKAQLAQELKNMDPKQRLELIEKATGHLGPRGEHLPHTLEGKVSVDAHGKPLDTAHGGKGPQDLVHPPGGKPGDLHGEGKGIGPHDMHAEGRGGKPHDNPSQQIDGKLLAQLQSLGRTPDLRSSFADLLNNFQAGALTSAGRDGAFLSILQGMRPGDLSGIQAWLTDSRRNQFDFRGMDLESQRGISKIFDGLLNRGQDRTFATVLDTNGLRSVADLNVMMARNLGGERGQTDFRLNISDMDPALQAILSRLQARDLSTSSTDKLLDNKAEGRDNDGKPGVKLSESALEAINRGELGRGLGARSGEAGQSAESTTTKSNSAESKDGSRQDETKEQLGLTPEQLNAQLAEQKRLELEEAKKKEEEEQQRKLEEQKEQEKDKDEKKKQADEERLYIVMPNDTLNSISRKFFQKIEHAEIIYARNIDNIMLHDYKDQKYAKLYPRQRITIPNLQYIDEFRASTKSYRHINFDRIPYASADEELEQMFGKNWAEGATAGLSKVFPDSKGDREPVKRRIFSGNAAPISDTKRRTNVHAALGLNTATANQAGRYTVHLGESLRSIAQKFYKSPTYWKVLALKNNLSTATDQKGNPTTVLRRGQQLILPDSVELESFTRNPDSPYIVALHTNDVGMLLPRNRHCGYCKRSTLAMAVNCISCGLDMNAYAESHSDDGQRSAGKPPGAILSALNQAIGQVASVKLQDVTLTNKFEPINFSPETSQSSEQTAVQQIAQPQAPHDPHPLPAADLSKVEFGFGEVVEDPTFTAMPEPLVLDQFVQVIETETFEQDNRGLVISLQLFSQGQWLDVFDYHIFPDAVVIHKYQRQGGRRMMKKSLPAKQSKQLAWNHFKSNWEAICKEYWSS